MEHLPASFVEQTLVLLGKEDYMKLENALQEEPPVSIRLNGLKQLDFKRMISGCPLGVPWCETGYYLKERLTFTFDPLFHAGAYYVQEASSMFVEQALRQYATKPAVVLDLCAAPGGKSTHLRSLLPEGSLLVANEVVRNRSRILAENLIKWGHPGIVVTQNDPADFARLEGVFDMILADVPCSGEGMFRKDAGAIGEWSLENVNICWQRQRRVIADIWDCLKPGGTLIYSTCTYNTKEDEENIAWIMSEYGAEPLSVGTIPADWRITGNLAGKDFPVYRFLPHLSRGEGFFLAVLRKRGDELFLPVKLPRIRPDKKQLKVPVIPKECKLWLRDAGEYIFEVKGTEVIAFPKESAELYSLLSQRLKVVHAGIIIGELKGQDLIPHQSLAMSLGLDKSVFPKIEVTYAQAIAYLRKEAIILSCEAPRGYVLLMYEGSPLGFVKNIGSRANNLYPQEWRIRSSYLPEEIKVLFEPSGF